MRRDGSIPSREFPPDQSPTLFTVLGLTGVPAGNPELMDQKSLLQEKFSADYEEYYLVDLFRRKGFTRSSADGTRRRRPPFRPEAGRELLAIHEGACDPAAPRVTGLGRSSDDLKCFAFAKQCDSPAQPPGGACSQPAPWRLPASQPAQPAASPPRHSRLGAARAGS